MRKSTLEQRFQGRRNFLCDRRNYAPLMAYDHLGGIHELKQERTK